RMAKVRTKAQRTSSLPSAHCPAPLPSPLVLLLPSSLRSLQWPPRSLWVKLWISSPPSSIPMVPHLLSPARLLGALTTPRLLPSSASPSRLGTVWLQALQRAPLTSGPATGPIPISLPAPPL